MLRRFFRRSVRVDRPVILSITDVAETEAEKTEIIRNHSGSGGASEFYYHAREIYFRAQRRPAVRAAGIF